MCGVGITIYIIILFMIKIFKTMKDYLEKIRDELSDVNSENIFTEPANKETATCIGLSAIK